MSLSIDTIPHGTGLEADHVRQLNVHISRDAVLVVREGAKIGFAEKRFTSVKGAFPSYQETPAAYVILKRRDLQLQVSKSVNNRLCVYKAAITVLFSPLLCRAKEGGFFVDLLPSNGESWVEVDVA